MKIVIAAVGRAKAGPERSLFDTYQQRISWDVELREVEEKRNLPDAKRIANEGEMLLAQVPPGGRIVALDEHGKSTTSRAFATALQAWRDDGIPATAFLIGGADGHSPEVVRKANMVLSFGKLTWPHMLARAMLAEQLYRAQTIISGHPYHRD
jgi:23S rRNA (pseudouridine1915-N3)-methyltransferase